MPTRDVTDPQAVRKAIAEHDRIGEVAFLAKYGFGRARDLFLIMNGKEYASKAIYGVALRHQYGQRLTAEDFSGGLVKVVGPLEAMGFEILDKRTGTRNPPWSRDELILALDLYHQVNGRFPGERDPAVVHLSEQLNALHRALGTTESTTLRNPNGVAMKLMNFRRFDPRALNEGRSGLTRGNKLEQEVWDLFHDDHGRLRVVAQAILADLEARPSGDLGAASDPLLSDTEEAPEGRVLTVTHLRRERSRELVRSKKNRVMGLKGKLECEACGFDFATRYGQHGHGFIECHHTKPVETLVEGHKTRLEDLALLCANCHRMIHAKRPWLSVEQLRQVMRSHA